MGCGVAPVGGSTGRLVHAQSGLGLVVVYDRRLGLADKTVVCFEDLLVRVVPDVAQRQGAAVGASLLVRVTVEQSPPRETAQPVALPVVFYAVHGEARAADGARS